MARACLLLQIEAGARDTKTMVAIYIEKVREILSHHGRLSESVPSISDDSDLYDAGLTSLATVGVMLALEEGFDIEFPDSMLSRRTFASIESLAAAVENLVAKRESMTTVAANG
jgi:acyl carrier protein